MKKKIVALILAVITVVACFAGCANNGGPGGTVTLKWAIGNANQRDTQLLQVALNKKLETLLPGVQIEFVEQTPEKWNNWMAAGQAIDIAWTGYAYSMEEQIRLKAFTELDDLIAQHAPNIQKEMETYKLDYDTGRYTDGKLYAIPNQQPFIEESPYMIIPGETLEYLDVDAFLAEMAKSPYTTRKAYEILDEYLQEIKANNATDTDYTGKYININYFLELIAMRGYYDITSGYCYKMWNDDGTVVTEPVLQHKYETDAFKLWTEYIIKWQKDGLASPVLTDAGISGEQVPLISGHLNGMWNDFSGEYDDEARGIKATVDSYGNVISYQINIEPRDYSHNYYAGANLGAEKTYMVIPYTCKHPKEAIQLLDLMRAPKGTPGNDFLNMVVYGFAKDSPEHQEYGVYHYTLNGDQIHSDEYVQQASASTSYGQPHWSVGNVYLTYRTELIAEGQQEYALKYDTETRLTFPVLPTAGFIFNTEKLVARLQSISDVAGDYGGRIDAGIEKDNTWNLIQESLQKQKQAGLEEIKNEWMRQYNEYKSK